MSASTKIKEILEKEKISYQILEHELAFTALEVAEVQHVPGRRMVKSVIVTAGGKPVMCVLPSTHKIDFEKLKTLLAAKDVQLANEGQVATLFPDFEVGAMPPFGQLAGIKVYVDKSLEENDAIVFNAGTHTDVMRIKFKDFVRFVRPIFADFGVHI